MRALVLCLVVLVLLGWCDSPVRSEPMVTSMCKNLRHPVETAYDDEIVLLDTAYEGPDLITVECVLGPQPEWV